MALLYTLWKSISSTFWSEWFWLPTNCTWKQLENTDSGIYLPQAGDIIIVLPLAVLLLVVRKLFERYFASPLGQYLGLSLTGENVEKPTPNIILEKFFHDNKKPTDADFVALQKQTDSTRRQIERWFRNRRNQDRTKTLHKFTESSWRFIFYLLIFWYGVVVLHNKPWVWDRKLTFQGWPYHHVTNDIFWYYAIEAGFYVSLLISVFSDVRRKDFWEMVVHHLCTLGLMFTSYSGSLLRVGALVLVVHDAVDYWLEAAKLFKYIATVNKKWQPLCDILFVIFFIIWIATRLIIFPVWIIYNTLFLAPNYFGFPPLYFLINFMLVALQILHIFWSIIIGKIAWNAINKGGIEKDERSDSDIEVSGEEENSNKPEFIINGSHNLRSRVTQQESVNSHK
ncbi:ceramide synthase 6 [Patella vulgata]|uniref:ceramide synthase 6 n=1 Tax=Patella vulgata TaxID=6465 RepID=UPI00217FBEA1|nr:ceramide synthase 6 [Patella vulgata]